MKIAQAILLCAGFLLSASNAGTRLRAADDPLADARALWLGGKYAEAEEAYAKPAAAGSVPATVGLARCQAATGHSDKANETLSAAFKANSKSAELVAELSLLALDRGDVQGAGEQAAAAIKLDKNQLAARWVTAELARLAGNLEEAGKGYEWLVDHYNNLDVKGVEAQRYIGLAGAQFARWNRLSDQFDFLVNHLYPNMLEADPAFWPAHYEAGKLFLEKYNEADAAKEIKDALTLNPNAAEVHALAAAVAIQNFDLAAAQASVDEALRINPRLLDAHRAQADIHLANLDLAKAASTLEAALKLQPKSSETLGRLAATYAAIDGVSQRGPDSRFGKIAAEVDSRNPHDGEFYMALADSLDRLRRFPLAGRYYEVATERMPQLVEARGQWGLMLMRLGEETKAKKLLDESFKIDPFNVRVKNTLEVLEVLDGYETRETEHFIIKFDPKTDKLLVRYVALWLEKIYPELCKKFQFEPKGKTLFEIFNEARNTDGHGWFSARMVGLPDIHTIGACAGQMVAMQSPIGGRAKFNWARVLKHEFVHVLNLQQTDFNIPHWYTEALAVLNEGSPRPPAWNDVLVERVAKGKLFNLETINLGFIRPHSQEDWSLAYYQATLYAEYLTERFGAGAQARLLDAYAKNLGTRDALDKVFKIDQNEFERGYTKYVEEVAKNHAPRATEGPEGIVALRKAIEADPKNAGLFARLAAAQLQRQNYAEARRLADEALAIEPKEQLAIYARARVHLLIGENRQALELLEKGLNRDNPQENLLSLLAGLRLKSNDFGEAARLYELGAKHNPRDLKWTQNLAAAYLKLGDKKKLAEVLALLAAADADDLSTRMKLAELAITARDYPAAVRWANEALHVDVMNSGVHKTLGEALSGTSQFAEAAEEFEVSLSLNGDQPYVRFALADAYVQGKQPDKARRVLTELKEKVPNYPGVDALLESLQP